MESPATTAPGVLMVRATVTTGHVAEVEAAAAAMFDAIHAAGPEDVRYASLRVTDGEVFVALLAVEDGIGNPLTEIPEFRAFQQALGGWLAAPPVVERFRTVGAYRLF